MMATSPRLAKIMIPRRDRNFFIFFPHPSKIQIILPFGGGGCKGQFWNLLREGMGNFKGSTINEKGVPSKDFTEELGSIF
jgi:hypothetical protein